MADRKYYVLCESNCKFESMTKEQILAAIAEATGATVTAVDDAFITKIKDQNKGASIKLWVGTQAEYNAIVAAEGVDAETLYWITDKPEIAVDAEMSNTSANPVQNSVVKGYIDGKVSEVDGVMVIDTGDIYEGTSVTVAGGYAAVLAAMKTKDIVLFTGIHTDDGSFSDGYLYFEQYMQGSISGVADEFHYFYFGGIVGGKYWRCRLNFAESNPEVATVNTYVWANNEIAYKHQTPFVITATVPDAYTPATYTNYNLEIDTYAARVSEAIAGGRTLVARLAGNTQYANMTLHHHAASVLDETTVLSFQGTAFDGTSYQLTVYFEGTTPYTTLRIVEPLRVTEEYTSNGWKVRKWSNGECELWKNVTASVSGWTAWGGVVVDSNSSSATFEAGAYPVEFSAIPNAVASPNPTNTYGFGIYTSTGGTTTTAPSYKAWRGSSLTGTTSFTISLYVKGTIA